MSPKPGTTSQLYIIPQRAGTKLAADCVQRWVYWEVAYLANSLTCVFTRDSGHYNVVNADINSGLASVRLHWP